MSKLRRVLIVSGLLAMCGIFIVAPSALAVSSGGFGGRPANPDPSNPRTESIFIYTLKGGETKDDQVLVSNNSDKKVNIALYAVDGVTTNTGAYTCRQKSEARSDVGKWLALSKEAVTLQPAENALVDFSLTLPENADVGEHNGCLVFENADDDGEVVDGGALRLRTRQAIRVVATVPGELHRNIDIAEFSAAVTGGQQDYTLTLQNTGNVSADVDTKIILKDLLGNVVYENGGGYPVFANQKLDVNFTNKEQQFWGGWYRAQAIVSYDKRAGAFGTSDIQQLIVKESKEITVFLMPSPLALLMITLPIVLLVALLVWFMVRRAVRKRTKKQWGEYLVQQGDTIEGVARTHGVHWKKIASVNGIKAPYSINEGQKLKVPAVAKKVKKQTRSSESKKTAKQR